MKLYFILPLLLNGMASGQPPVKDNEKSDLQKTLASLVTLTYANGYRLMVSCDSASLSPGPNAIIYANLLDSTNSPVEGASLNFVAVAGTGQQLVTAPLWSQAARKNLPEVPSQTIQEVKALWPTYSRPPHEVKNGSKIADSDTLSAMQRMVELGEDADKALVWLYIDESLADDPTLRRKLLLSALQHDSNIARYMLPTLRSRMQWFTSEIDAGRCQSVPPLELISIHQYFSYQGEVDDIKSYRTLADMAAKRNCYAGFFDKLPGIERELEIFADVREFSRRHYKPHWMAVSEYLARQGIKVKASAR